MNAEIVGWVCATLMVFAVASCSVGSVLVTKAGSLQEQRLCWENGGVWDKPWWTSGRCVRELGDAA